MLIVPQNLPPFVPMGNGSITYTFMTKFPGDKDKELTTCSKLNIRFKFENKLKQSEKLMLT